ncbi:MAG: LPXTG cell wall anchor domain-containing protein, partial [Lactobacillus gasseri]|nr:LPXTG cell wall anchor domain-containing protein [Lactobacillus gasseri]
PDTAKAKDATKDKDATKTQDPAKAKDATKTQDPAKTQDATKGKDADKSMTKAQDPAKAKIANGKTLPNGTGSMGVTTGSVLPQTGNRPNNWLILAAGAALAALGLGFADKFSKQKDSRN